MVEKYEPGKVGVWIENGLVYRSDIGEDRLPRVPTGGHTPDEVFELTREIQEVANEGKGPKAGRRILLDDLIDRLNQISREIDRLNKSE